MLSDKSPSPLPDTMERPRWWRRRFALLPVILLVIVGSLAYQGLSVNEPPSVPLGASATVPGGLARVNGILPLEPDGGTPADDDSEPAAPQADGSHRVRIILELTVLEASGMDFDAAGYFVAGIGTSHYRPLSAQHTVASLIQGETFTVSFVFELPDRAVLLTLHGDGGLRLSLGTDHHSGAL